MTNIEENQVNKMRCGLNHIDKIDFFDAYPKAHTEDFTSNKIYRAFRATGLIPLSPGCVLFELTVQVKPLHQVVDLAVQAVQRLKHLIQSSS